MINTAKITNNVYLVREKEESEEDFIKRFTKEREKAKKAGNAKK